jgi:hypothetical protein
LTLPLSTARPIQAHRLSGSFHVLPGPKVRIESWFGGGDVPKGAKVHVYRANDVPLLSEPGVLDDQGIFVFAVDKIEPLKVVIAAGAGHSVTLQITASDLERPEPETATPTDSGQPRGERSAGTAIKDVLLGVTFILAGAAFILSVVCLRKLRDLGRTSDPPP